MKIRKLHIKNYKVFNDLELDFTDANGKTLDKIVLAGVNGCGKTTILEIIKKMYDGTLFDYTRKNRNCSIDIETSLSPSEIEFNSDVIEQMMKKQGQKYVPKYNSEITFGLSFNATIKDWGFHSDGISQLLYMPVNTIESSVKNQSNFRVINLSSSKQEMKSLVLKGIKDDIFANKDVTPRLSIEKGIKEINDILDGMSLTSKLVDLESEELIFESVNGERIKFEDLSNGEKTLYFRAIYLSKLAPKDSIIMVDEPEDSLHPTWQQKIMKLYQRLGKNNQIIVATHSPHIIGASNAEEVFLLEIEGNHVKAMHPRHMKGHSIEYILGAMGTDANDTAVINLVDSYLALMRKGMHETSEGCGAPESCADN